MTPQSQPFDDQALVALFERHGCTRTETAILQPADLFLDLSGEDIRRRLYVTQDAEGRDYCLRPEYTIPVCRQHIAGGSVPADYCYLGPVFRQRGAEPGEFLQAGFELLGGEGSEAADARALRIALEGLALCPASVDLRLGDMGLLGAVLDALAVPARLRRRLIGELSAGRGVAPVLADDTSDARSDYAGLLAAIEGQDPGAARAFIQDVISIAGIAQVGGRTAGEIADRFLAKAQNRGQSLSGEARAVLAAYVAVTGPIDEAQGSVASLARQAGIDLGAALAVFARRAAAFRAEGLDTARLTFRADFVRSIDYYTGVIFEGRRRDGALALAGGRYDDLLQHLGSPVRVPAVGCSFWLDRLAETMS